MQAYYFDTNILQQLIHGSSNVDFVKLRDSQKGQRNFFAPQVVYNELLQHQVKEAREQINLISSASRRLGRVLVRDPIQYERIEDLEEIVGKAVQQFFEVTQIDIIPTPEIPLATLLDMAVRKEPPFEEKKEKGFRDAVIMFTILGHMETKSFKLGTLITNDGIFTDAVIGNRFTDKGLNLTVAKTISEANQQLIEEIEKTVSTFVEGITKEIKQFLTDRKTQIFDFIHQNAEISESFVRGSLSLAGSELGLLGATIKRILGYRPKDIEKIYLGLIAKDATIPPDHTAVTFTVSVDIDLVIEQIGMGIFDAPKVRLSSLEDFEKIRYRQPAFSEVQTAVTREITVEGLILKRDGKFVELKLQRVLSY